LAGFSAHLFEQGAQSATVEAYLRDIRLFLQTPRDLSSLKPEDLDQWVQELSEQGMGNNAIARKVAALRRFCTFLQDAAVLTQSPAETIKIKRTQLAAPEAIRTEQLTALFLSPASTLRERKEIAIVAVLAGTGLRISELRRLQTKDVEVHTDLVWIRVYNRRIPLLGAPAEALRAYVPTLPLGPLFPWQGKPMTREGLWRAVRRRCAVSGVDAHAIPTKLRTEFILETLSKGHLSEPGPRATGLPGADAMRRYRAALRKRRAPIGR